MRTAATTILAFLATVQGFVLPAGSRIAPMASHKLPHQPTRTTVPRALLTPEVASAELLPMTALLADGDGMQARVEGATPAIPRAVLV